MAFQSGGSMWHRFGIEWRRSPVKLRSSNTKKNRKIHIPMARKPYAYLWLGVASKFL
ncbi:hypothetical protein [Dysgonomonas sp. Marseille-P4361]|uniref:hypothetical protein n=1 Tax=Dysgonomonas sp. Marseille-P4361 TaxID=2161820 RepID=UPI0013581240|nr:hypothetical protein [Dysgonomonas sp. Marseille-P4361]